MRIWWIAIPLILVIVGSWFFTYQILVKEGNIYISSIDSLKESIIEGNWENAKIELNVIYEKWKKVRQQWALIIDHQAMDSIDLAFARATEYLRSENQGLTLGELQVLIVSFQMIKENEALTLTNLF